MSKQREVLVVGHGASYPDMSGFRAKLDDKLREQADRIATLEARCARLHKALRRQARNMLRALSHLDRYDAVYVRVSDNIKTRSAERAGARWMTQANLAARESRGWGKCPSVERMEEQ